MTGGITKSDNLVEPKEMQVRVKTSTYLTAVIPAGYSMSMRANHHESFPTKPVTTHIIEQYQNGEWVELVRISQ